MAKSEWIRRSPRYWTRCSKRHHGCGAEISPSSETAWMLPPNGKRIRFYFLCGRCAREVGLLSQTVSSTIAPQTFVRPEWCDR